MKDYYSILGVSPSAHVSEIKRAYRRLAVQYHPDKNADPRAEEVFKEINEAYDVLSDPDKKSTYDWKRQNPLTEIFQEPAPPQHRDPYYQKRRPRRPVKSEAQQRRELMQQYLPYVFWLCWAGIIVSSLFGLDYVLPYKSMQERIVDGYRVEGRRGFSHYIFVTESGKKIKVYNHRVQFGETIEYDRTLIYSTVMSITTAENTIPTGYTYRGLVLFPIATFLTSLLGILFKHDIEFSFNSSIVNGILLIITLFLIL